MPNHDLDWLISLVPTKDYLGLSNTRVRSLTKIIRNLDNKVLPFTIGLFGNWGCGKTTFLAYLAQDLKSDHSVIYFNAWKYAGFLEIVPALIYNILGALPIKSISTMDEIGQIMLFLGRKYGSQVGEWAAKFLGVNPADIVKDIIELGDSINDPKKIRKKVLDQYYTQVDKAQDLLKGLVKPSERPLIVLIDELDRCDPGEAFEVIKQLRIFFSMRKLPIIFVLSANPEPIGLAIRHQYGFDKGITDYEANRILEKFVDSYVDMSDPLPLAQYILNLWEQYSPGAKGLSFVHDLDSQIRGFSYNIDTVKNSNVFTAITTNNRLYSNLRVLDKSLRYVQTYARTVTDLIWSAWHLEILKQVHSELFKEVSMLASEIGWIATNAHYRLIKDLLPFGLRNQNTGSLSKKIIDFNSDKGNTAFSNYRSWFWEISRVQIEKLNKDRSTEGIERKRILKKWLGNHNLMTFVVCMTLHTIPNVDTFVKECDRMASNEWIENWREIGHFKHFSWLLANY
jgi:hypothetical protein